MNLITRCPSCGTTFRVQPTQLSVRGGKVRCGKCGTVFNGVAALVEQPSATARPEPSPQLGLFGAPAHPAAAALLAELEALDVDALRPLDALNLLAGMKKRLGG